MDPDGKNQTQITFCSKMKEGENYVSSPAWSPDNTQIVFTGACNSLDEDAVYTVEIGSGKLTRLTFEKGNFLYPSWSNHGDRIAYIFEDQLYKSRLLIMNTDGSNQIELKTGVSRVGWCPDDRCIIYQDGYGPGYQSQLMVYDLDFQTSSPLLSVLDSSDYQFLSMQSPVRGLIVFS